MKIYQKNLVKMNNDQQTTEKNDNLEMKIEELVNNVNGLAISNDNVSAEKIIQNDQGNILQPQKTTDDHSSVVNTNKTINVIDSMTLNQSIEQNNNIKNGCQLLTNNEKIESSLITLTEEQQPHSEKIERTLREHGIVIDVSNTGKGKSIIFCTVMKRMNIQKIIMVCTSNIIPQWKAYFSMYDLDYQIITYQSLRGITVARDTVLSHGLLIRRADDSFCVTEKFMNLVENYSTVVVFDECQNLKNRCDQQRASSEFSRYFKQRKLIDKQQRNSIGSNNYQTNTDGFLRTTLGVYYMSATPFDLPHHLLNFCTTSAIIPNEYIFNPKNNSLEGLYHLREYCLTLDQNKVNQIWGMYEVKTRNAEEIAYELCKDILLPNISSFVKEPIIATSKNQSIYYCYFQLPQIAIDTIKIADEFIHSRAAPIIDASIHHFYSWLIQAPSPLAERNGITHGQITRQTILTKYTIIPAVFQAMHQIPNCKIVIFLSYKEAVNLAARDLACFNPTTLTGDDDIETRNRIVAKFQEPNLESRILITTNQISAAGGQFDDIYGDFPRVGFSLQTHIITDSTQAPGRIDRHRTKSKSLFFFGKVEFEENLQISVERSIDIKSKILLQTLRESGVLAPNSFEILRNIHTLNMYDLLINAGKRPEKKIEEAAAPPKNIIIKKSSLAEFRAFKTGHNR
jgi:hypothetical protein